MDSVGRQMRINTSIWKPVIPNTGGFTSKRNQRLPVKPSFLLSYLGTNWLNVCVCTCLYTYCSNTSSHILYYTEKHNTFTAYTFRDSDTHCTTIWHTNTHSHIHTKILTVTHTHTRARTHTQTDKQRLYFPTGLFIYMKNQRMILLRKKMSC